MQLNARWSKCVSTLAVLLLMAAVAPVVASAAQEPAKPQQAAPAGAQMSAAEMQEMMKLGSPGEHHKRLGNFVGHWTTKTKMWMAPGQPPAESAGTMDAEWAMGGRYLMAHHRGMMMGMPFEGQEIDGYDNVSGKYVSSWIDNMGTGILNTSGSCDDPDCKVVTLTGEAIDPVSKEKGAYKEVTTWLGPGSFKFELYWTGASGTSMKIMEMTATKK
jgi:hypothetical protein